MKDKVVIVTGGSSGMGKAMATKLAGEGAKVVITGRKLDKLNETKAELKSLPGQVMTFQMDVRKFENVQDMVSETKQAFGRIDALINNAAGNFTCPAEELSFNGWHAVVSTVLDGTWYCTQAVGKDWIASGQPGKILNMIATTAWTGAAGVVHSASSKAAVLALTRTLAVEWGYKYGIRVNAIAPGPIESTGGAARMFPTEHSFGHTLADVPVQRLGRLDEIADLACYMLSPQGDYINGECITIDGGQWLNRRGYKERLEAAVQSKKT